MSNPSTPPLSNLALVELVCRIRDTVAAFNKSVGGSSEFIEELISDDRIPIPYCWCVPMLEYGDEINQDEGTQVRHILMAFIVCVDNKAQKGDGLGNNAPRVHDSISPLQDAIEQSLLTWAPISIRLDRPIEWRQRTFLGMDNTEAHYQLEFEMTYVRFSPYYFHKAIRDVYLEEEAGTITGAADIKQIAARYNVEEGVIRTSIEDGYFALPNTAIAPPVEEVAEAWDEAAVLDVEGADTVNDIEQVQGGKSPIPSFEHHGIKSEKP